MSSTMRNLTLGRPVRLVSISFPNGPGLGEIAALVDREASLGTDLIVLPETWLGQEGHIPEPLEGPTVQTMASLAGQHHTYIVCPVDRLDGPYRRNTAVLIDRCGRVCGLYDKAFPYWSEFEVLPPVAPGCQVPVFQTDFGRLGIAICFDVNFPQIWQRLADGGSELVVWCSAYSAGTALQAYALIHHYAIASSTQTSDCLVYDITGRVLLDEQGEGVHVSRIVLDLDRGIYHENFNIEKRDQLLAEHGNEVEVETALSREQWFVLRSRRPGASARELARQYGLEELRDYIARSQSAVDARRGRSIGGGD